jgi:hypothetical protein
MIRKDRGIICGIFFTIILCCSVLRAQAPGLVDRKALVRDSSLIVSGAIERELWLVNEAKMTTEMKRPSIPNPADFVVGRLFLLQTAEIVKGNTRLKVGRPVSIFVSGSFSTEGAPAFVQREKYLVLLTPLKATAGYLSNTTSFDPQSGKTGSFDKTSVYVVVGGEYGVVPITPHNRSAIQEIRAAVRNRRK